MHVGHDLAMNIWWSKAKRKKSTNIQVATIHTLNTTIEYRKTTHGKIKI